MLEPHRFFKSCMRDTQNAQALETKNLKASVRQPENDSVPLIDKNLHEYKKAWLLCSFAPCEFIEVTYVTVYLWIFKIMKDQVYNGFN